MAILSVTRSADGRYMSVCWAFFIFNIQIGGVEHGESTGSGADNRSF